MRRYPASAALSPASIFSAASDCMPGFTWLARRLQSFRNQDARSPMGFVGTHWEAGSSFSLQMATVLVAPCDALVFLGSIWAGQ